MRVRQIAFRILVPVFTMLVMLLLAELVLRLPVFSAFMDYEPTLLGGPLAYLPNQDSRHRLGADFDIQIHINSRGFRDSEFVPAPKSHTVLALGDSFTEGWGVDLEKAWPKQLEARLDGRYEHVYDAGRSGTNPKNYAAVYEKFFDADTSVELVVVGVCLSNDIIEEGTPTERVSRPPSLFAKVKFYALKYSVLANIVHRSMRYNPRVEQFLADLGLTKPQRLKLDFSSDPANSRRWAYSAEFLASFGARVEASGRRFLVVLIPTKEQVVDGYIEALMEQTGNSPADIDLFGFRDYLLRGLTEKGVDVLDLTPFLDQPAQGTTADYYFHADIHWNAAGHALAAEKIAEHLRKQPAPQAESPHPPAVITAAGMGGEW
jgi:lysophospholipase L1-like esterase